MLRTSEAEMEMGTGGTKAQALPRLESRGVFLSFFWLFLPG